jgi:hypothetical protein
MVTLSLFWSVWEEDVPEDVEFCRPLWPSIGDEPWSELELAAAGVSRGLFESIAAELGATLVADQDIGCFCLMRLAIRKGGLLLGRVRRECTTHEYAPNEIAVSALTSRVRTREVAVSSDTVVACYRCTDASGFWF